MSKIRNVEDQAQQLVNIAYEMGYGDGEKSRRADLAPTVNELRRAIKDVISTMQDSKLFHDNAPILIGLRKLLVDTDPESGTCNPLYESVHEV